MEKADKVADLLAYHPQTVGWEAHVHFQEPGSLVLLCVLDKGKEVGKES